MFTKVDIWLTPPSLSPVYLILNFEIFWIMDILSVNFNDKEKLHVLPIHNSSKNSGSSTFCKGPWTGNFESPRTLLIKVVVNSTPSFFCRKIVHFFCFLINAFLSFSQECWQLDEIIQTCSTYWFRVTLCEHELNHTYLQMN